MSSRLDACWDVRFVKLQLSSLLFLTTNRTNDMQICNVLWSVTEIEKMALHTCLVTGFALKIVK